MQCSAAGRLTPRLLRQGCQLLPARTACAPRSLAGVPRSMSLTTNTDAQPQQEQEQQQQQEPVSQQQQQPAPIHIVVNIKHVPQADWAAATANNATKAGKGGSSSSDGVKKKVKRNVAMHIGYVGTHYTGTSVAGLLALAVGPHSGHGKAQTHTALSGQPFRTATAAGCRLLSS